MEEYIQIGIMAQRDENGNFLPAIPLFIKQTDAAKKSAENLINDIVPLIRARFEKYVLENELSEKNKVVEIEAEKKEKENTDGYSANTGD